jgi:hypothetical protein
MNGELETMFKKPVVAQFKTSTRNLLDETEENHRRRDLVEFEPGTSGT